MFGFLISCQTVSKVVYLMLSLTMYEISMSLPTFGIVSFSTFSPCGGYVIISCGFNLHFPDD